MLRVPDLARAGLIGLAVLVLAHTARADVVTMKDGRRFEGRVVDRAPAEIRLDTRIGSIRTILTLPSIEIASVDDKPLPDGFFDPPPVEPRRSAPRQEQTGTLYLEVPIVGAFGQQVFAEGVKRVLGYAKGHRIRHVVFMIDSMGGDIDEATAIYQQLRRYDPHMTYHAVIRRCGGDALSVPLWCETVHFAPGAVLGGDNAIVPADENDDPEAETLMRSELAHEVAIDAESRGMNGPMIRAMIDPEETIAVWRDEQGELVVGVTLPAGMAGDRVVANVGVGDLLVIDESMALELGVRPSGGTAQELGDLLGIDDWYTESEYAAETMAKTATRLRRKAQADDAKFEKKVEHNIRRRASIDRLIEGSLKSAQQWDPSSGTYEYYSRRYRWSSTYGGYRGRSGRGSSSWTLESQDRWKSRTDATLYFLDRAARGIRPMNRLDREAQKLGLEPTYGPGELEMMLTDVNAKAAMLMNQRGRRGR
jgi:hypothetical protein